jgi:hypothetical protein
MLSAEANFLTQNSPPGPVVDLFIRRDTPPGEHRPEAPEKKASRIAFNLSLLGYESSQKHDGNLYNLMSALLEDAKREN